MLMPLLVAAGLLVVSLLSFSLAAALILQLVVQLIRTGYSGRSVWKNVSFMLIVSFVTAAAHLVQIALWAVAYLMVGEFSTFDKAFYFSSQNYTALGYGDVILSERWRQLGPLESINGLLLFGLSTGVMLAVMSRLVKSRLRVHLGHTGGAEERMPAISS